MKQSPGSRVRVPAVRRYAFGRLSPSASGPLSSGTVALLWGVMHIGLARRCAGYAGSGDGSCSSEWVLRSIPTMTLALYRRAVSQAWLRPRSPSSRRVDRVLSGVRRLTRSVSGRALRAFDQAPFQRPVSLDPGLIPRASERRIVVSSVSGDRQYFLLHAPVEHCPSGWRASGVCFLRRFALRRDGFSAGFLLRAFAPRGGLCRGQRLCRCRTLRVPSPSGGGCASRAPHSRARWRLRLVRDCE